MNRPQAPTAAQLQREVDRVRDRKRFQSALCRTLGALALIAAFVAAVVYMAPVLRVRGTSMSPTLSEGDVLVALRGIPCGRGDIAAFDDGTHILVKRIIAGAGDVVAIGEDGALTVVDGGGWVGGGVGGCDFCVGAVAGRGGIAAAGGGFGDGAARAGDAAAV